ncbi:MAG: CPBP family glutamic-type intramembrane protease [Brachybacterium sp.]|nr:CPBP family glutamic-type intramembrane protease [Brachybacterium sp.]
MLTFLLYALPTVVYVIWRTRRGDEAADAIADAGARPGNLAEYGIAAVTIIPVALIGWGAMLLVPAGLLQAGAGGLGQVLAPMVVILTMVRAAGQEIFFRGLLGGVLARRFGEGIGNLVQAALFALPTAALLAVSVGLLPIVLGQFLVGLLLGRLRMKLGTCFPGILSAGLGAIGANALFALLS